MFRAAEAKASGKKKLNVSLNIILPQEPTLALRDFI